MSEDVQKEMRSFFRRQEDRRRKRSIEIRSFKKQKRLNEAKEIQRKRKLEEEEAERKRRKLEEEEAERKSFDLIKSLEVGTRALLYLDTLATRVMQK